MANMQSPLYPSDLRYAPTLFWRAVAGSRVVRGAYGWMMRRLFGLQLQNQKLAPLPGPYIIAANHGSHYDLFLGLAAFCNATGAWPVPVVWCGVAKIPIVGGFLKALPCVWVDHSQGEEADRVTVLREMIGHLRNGRYLLMACEGQRQDALGEFAQGAALAALHTGVAVVPVSLLGVQGLYDEMTRPRRFWGRVEIVIHAPLAPSAFERTNETRAETLARFTTAIREQVASQLDYSAKT
jgi:1-acyl-sn-glycerol-3-phosphate acyltransferase